MVTSIIAITGPSGSGKTSLAQVLRQELQISFPGLGIEILAEDSYYHDLADLSMQEREQVNFDHPSALEHDLLLTHLRELKAGAAVDVPNYDYTRHTRHVHTRPLEPTKLLIVEGILLLSHAQLRGEFDLRLFIDTPLDVCLSRRMARDAAERGRSPESIEQQFAKTVIPMFHEHIAPTRDHAHLVLSGEETPQDLSRQVQLELKQRGYLER
ncbi:MAG: uridine kinase [Pseudomonadales bacterium]|nr:uridine kinase [Pseudomonadales bacterium]